MERVRDRSSGPRPRPGRWGAALLLAAGLVAQGSPGALPAAAAGRDELTAWVHEHAVRLDSLDRRALPDTQRAALDRALAPLLAGRRVVMLGEPDHGIRDTYDYRLLCLDLLVGCGFRHVGMEMGRADGVLLDEHLATGDEARFRATALAGNRAHLRPDRSDAIDAFDPDRHPEVHRRVVEETLRFHRALRALAGEGDRDRLRWFGYDVSFLPGGGYADVERVLGPHADREGVAALRAAVERVPGESRIAEAARLDRALARIAGDRDALASVLGTDGVRDVRHALETLAASFRFLDAARDRRWSDERRAAMTARDAFMARRVLELVGDAPDAERFVLLGHDLHLSRDSTAMQLGSIAMWPSAGTLVCERLAEQCLVVWLLYDHGHRADPESGQVAQPRPSIPGTLEAAFAAAAPRFVLPLRGVGPLPAALRSRQRLAMGGTVTECVLADQCDVVVFLAAVVPPGAR